MRFARIIGLFEWSILVLTAVRRKTTPVSLLEVCEVLTGVARRGRSLADASATDRKGRMSHYK